VQVSLGDKFAAISLRRASVEIDKPMALPGDLVVMPAAPVQFDETWEKWLGSIQAEAISKANLVILATAPSTRAEVLDQENSDLEQRVFGFLYGMLFMGMPLFEDGFAFTGANVNGTPNIRSIGRLDGFQVTYHGRPFTFLEQHLATAYELYVALSDLWQTRGSYRRLKRGIDAFLQGLKEDLCYYRIHQFCRSLEALILPSPGRTAKQFSARCQTLAAAKGIVSILDNIYDLRCRVEHLHEFDDFRPGETPDARDDLIALRTRQAEAIARAAYRCVLSSPAVRRIFLDDEAIGAFWQQPADVRSGQWGTRVDVTSA